MVYTCCRFMRLLLIAVVFVCWGLKHKYKLVHYLLAAVTESDVIYCVCVCGRLILEGGDLCFRVVRQVLVEARLLAGWEWAWPGIRLADKSRQKENELSYGAMALASICLDVSLHECSSNRVDLFINFGKKRCQGERGPESSNRNYLNLSWNKTKENAHSKREKQKGLLTPKAKKHCWF